MILGIFPNLVPGGPKTIKNIVFWKFDHYFSRDLFHQQFQGTMVFFTGRLDFQGCIVQDQATSTSIDISYHIMIYYDLFLLFRNQRHQRHQIGTESADIS